MISAGDQYRTGLDLLANATAAADWQRGVALVDDAAGAGLAEAIERRALFECMGVGRTPDWNRAIESLHQAVDAGSRTAAGQLRTIGSDPIVTRLRAPPPQATSADPLIRTISDFANEAECRWLIESVSPRLERAIVYNNATREHGADPGRTNQFALVNFVNLDVVTEMLRTRLAVAIGAPLPCLEVSQVLRYGIGEEFAPHWDYLDPGMLGDEIARRGQRAVTVLVYLNADFEGGETSFPELGISHRGKTGDALVFSNVDPAGRPDPRTKHAGCPPTSGEKWLFSQWVRDRVPAA
jgi:prolyl 4-hydroxylase